MNEQLMDTLVRKLERLPDDTARQLLDYVEFLESRYHKSVRQRTPLERLADNIEDTLSATRISKAAFKGTAQVLDAAGNVMRGVVAAGQAVVDELGRADGGRKEPEPAEPAAGAPASDEPPADRGDATAEDRLTKD